MEESVALSKEFSRSLLGRAFANTSFLFRRFESASTTVHGFFGEVSTCSSSIEDSFQGMDTVLQRFVCIIMQSGRILSTRSSRFRLFVLSYSTTIVASDFSSGGTWYLHGGMLDGITFKVYVPVCPF